jgi:hypothetical protein
MTTRPTGAGSRRLVLAAMTAALVAAATPIGAGANVSDAGGDTWSIQKPVIPLVHSGALAGVSCRQVDDCMAVGSYGSGVRQLTLAERWDGHAWELLPTPNRAGVDNQLTGVSCSSAKACTAVGYDDTVRKQDTRREHEVSKTLVERWDGSTWTIQPSPSPNGLLRPGLKATLAELTAVDCTSPTDCVAVGDHFNTAAVDTVLVEHWDGKAWAVQPAPQPEGARASVFTAVSCTQPDACTAVGYYTKRFDRRVALAERWDGRSWSVQLDHVAGAVSSGLSSVSCTSRRACMAVGFSSDSTVGYGAPLGARWDGSVWTFQRLPPPSGFFVALTGVSCARSIACSAVGFTYNGGPTAAFVERWDGSIWTLQELRLPRQAEGVRAWGISCPRADVCIYVGSYADRFGRDLALVDRWDGTQWSYQRSPNPLGEPYDTGLASVSCSEADACVAVGSYSYSVDLYAALAEDWDGARWRIAPLGNEANPVAGMLAGVSCNEPRACMAVGGAISERWDGSAWIAHTPASPGGPVDLELQGVSCIAEDACEAVGYQYAGRETTLAERWNGRRWIIQTTSAPDDAGTGVLSSVSCVGTAFCMAVGTYSSYRTLAEVWNGSSWTPQTPPDPTSYAMLNPVSCARADECTAVGLSYDAASNEYGALIERWDGQRWRIQRAPRVPYSELTGVSCPSDDECTAAGNYSPDSSEQRVLIERWDGAGWVTERVPDPSAGEQYLESLQISCAGSDACVAVGSYKTSRYGEYKPFSEVLTPGGM